ncbi:hypothetical protein NQ314_013930 [Rhamnusium bicolor]|uniref:Transposase n=1 Tax=Rhamnusium bicolor TaxID=1586634 RepID=A0AAV8X4S8_9CUCU|nr:hypothetical protein NQ314_013930 [Rhamnusium bicolor]
MKKEFKFSGNTSNLHFHLKRKHPTFTTHERLLEDFEDEIVAGPGVLTTEPTVIGEARPSTSSGLISDEPVPEAPKKELQQTALSFRAAHMSEMRKKKIDKLVIEMICKDFQPISVVEDIGFKNLIKELEPRYNLSSRRTIGRTLLPDAYSQIKTKLMDILKTTITTDIWTSSNTESYITLTCHLILNSNLKSYVLVTAKLSEQHTGEHLANIMRHHFNEWGISNKISAIVRDNAANIKNAVRILNYENLPCAAHTLNLVMTDVLKDIPAFDNIIKTCRSIVGHFKMSVVASDKLTKMQQQMAIGKYLKFKQDVSTRWNSSLLMIQRMVLLKEPLSATMVSLPNCPQSLNNEEWSILEDCALLLKPFELITAELSADSYVTVSIVIPLMRALQTHVSQQKCITPVGQALKDALLQRIGERLIPYERRPLAQAATYLNTRFKKNGIWDRLVCDRGGKFGKKRVNKIVAFPNCNRSNRTINEGASTSAVTEPSEESKTKINIWQTFDNKVKNLIQTKATPLSDSIVILKKYSDLPYENRDVNPLAFWNQTQLLFPQLSNLARKKNCSKQHFHLELLI